MNRLSKAGAALVNTIYSVRNSEHNNLHGHLSLRSALSDKLMNKALFSEEDSVRNL